ncbi:MAG: NACHT domain-containing protein [Erysipelotrichaceae bacterium]|nr:NACHT domain-containing protein [Erysipelotrichaceae bacterium]
MLNEKIKTWFAEAAVRYYDMDHFEEAFAAFDMFLESNGSYYDFGKAIEDMYNAGRGSKVYYLQKFSNIEIYMKALYNCIAGSPVYTLDPEVNDTLMLAKQYRDTFHIMPSDWRPNPEKTEAFKITDSEYDGIPLTGYMRYYLDIYQLRNRMTHSAMLKLDDMDADAKANSMIVCYLDLAYRHRNEIAGKFRVRSLDLNAYADKVIRRYNSFLKGYKYLDVKWMDSQEHGLTVDGLIGEEESCLKLAGDAGTGKTTALMRLAYLMAQSIKNNNSRILPVYIPLARLTAGDRMLYSETAKELGASFSEAERLIQNGQICLLLDGLNEILNLEVRSKLAFEADGIAAMYPDVRIVFTDRAVIRPSVMMLSNARTLHLMPLTVEDKMTYFEENCSDPETLQIIRDRVASNSGILNDLTKPIQLRQFLEVVQEKKEIPFEMTGDYLDMLMERERNEKKDTNIDYLPYYLEALATEMKKKQMKEVGQDRFLQLMAEVNFSYGFTVPDTMNCQKLLVDMGILQLERNRRISFTNDKFRIYYEMTAAEKQNELS